MATYPFKHIEHTNYKNTFLQNVIVGISFKEKEDAFFNDTFLQRLNDYLKSMFNIGDQAKQIDFKTQGFTLTSQSQDIAISFQNGILEAKIGCKSYTGFISAFSSIFIQFKLFLKQVMLEENIIEIRERKVNIWQFESKEKLNYTDVASNVFSTELNAQTSNIGMAPKEANTIQKKIYWDITENKDIYGVIVRTAFLNEKEGLYHLVLDSEVIQKDTEIKKDDLDINFVTINNILFDAYHWAVSPKIIELMK